MRLLIVMMIAALTLTGCASGPQPTLAPVRLPPPSLTEPCPVPTQPLDGKLARSLLPNHVQAMELLALCRARHQSLSQWVTAPASSPASGHPDPPAGLTHE